MPYKIITPPDCIGIMGGGQLGRMFSIAAKQMGYKVAILEPSHNCPAKQFADYFIEANYDDINGLDKLAKYAKVVTTEFENVPAKSMEYLAKHIPVSPNFQSILISQNRLEEKHFFNQLNIKTTQFKAINNISDLEKTENMFPAILKTNTLGYDGKGQIRVNSLNELKVAFLQLNKVDCILEKLVNLKLEVSILVARNSFETITYPVVQNIHSNGILDITLTETDLSKIQIQQIENYAALIADKLNYIGILAIEFFITQNDEILANEMAPRPHNSGHYTLDACATSQFEQQVRSICNLKLGLTNLTSHAIMLNLLGDIWPKNATNAHPEWSNVLAKHSNLKLHLYEKDSAKPGRKMGHLTIVGDNMDVLRNQISQIKHELKFNS